MRKGRVFEIETIYFKKMKRICNNKVAMHKAVDLVYARVWP